MVVSDKVIDLYKKGYSISKIVDIITKYCNSTRAGYRVSNYTGRSVYYSSYSKEYIFKNVENTILIYNKSLKQK